MAARAPVLTSTANPRVKAVQALRRRRVRERDGLTAVEGLDELALAVEAGAVPRTLFHCPELSPVDGADLLARVAALGTDVVECDPRVFAAIAYRESPDGWLGVLPTPGSPLAGLPASSFLLVGQAVEKPGNLGAMLRTADAVGLGAVIAADPVTDWGNPNLVRASKGTVFSVPVAAAGTAAALAWLAARGLRVVAATPDGPTRYTDIDYRGPVAIAVGSERHGLTEPWLAAPAIAVRIPMAGRVNSLNVATTAAIIAYEAHRQRTSRPG